MANYSEHSSDAKQQAEKKRIPRYIFILIVVFLVAVGIYMLIHSQPV
ncbi:MAG: hypothetical protein QM666_01350 [Acinetobacter sp.]